MGFTKLNVPLFIYQTLDEGSKKQIDTLELRKCIELGFHDANIFFFSTSDLASIPREKGETIDTSSYYTRYRSSTLLCPDNKNLKPSH